MKCLPGGGWSGIFPQGCQRGAAPGCPDGRLAAHAYRGTGTAASLHNANNNNNNLHFVSHTVLQIRDVYPGSRIPNPKLATKERGEKNLLS